MPTPSRRIVLAWTALLAPGTAFAQTPENPPNPPNPRVRLETAEGEIIIELFAEKAPITVANYLRYVDRELFNGASFYRASRPAGYTATDYGVVQGGLQNNRSKLMAPIAHEPTSETGI